MKQFLSVSLFSACLGLIPAQAADPAHLKLLTEDYPPFNMADASGRITGLSTEIVHQLLQRAGISHDIELLPWVRAFNRAVLEPGTCVYSTTRTEQREHQLKWIGPIVENPWVLYARNDNKTVVTTLESVRPYRLGGYSGDAIAQYLISKNFEVDLASTDVQNVRKLVAGRIDFWATGKYSGATLATREKAADIRPVMTFNTTFMYLACHPRMDDRTVALLNSTLDRMRKDGTVAKITARYHQD